MSGLDGAMADSLDFEGGEGPFPEMSALDADALLAGLASDSSALASILASNGLAGDLSDLARLLSRTETATNSKLDGGRRRKRQGSVSAHHSPAQTISEPAVPASPALSAAESFYSFVDPGDFSEPPRSPFGEDADAASLFGDFSEQDFASYLASSSALAEGPNFEAQVSVGGPIFDAPVTVEQTTFPIDEVSLMRSAAAQVAQVALGSPYDQGGPQLLELNFADLADFSDHASDVFDDAASYLSSASLGGDDAVPNVASQVGTAQPSVVQGILQALGLGNLFQPAVPRPMSAAPGDIDGSSSYASSSYAGSEADWDDGDGEGEDTDDAASVYTQDSTAVGEQGQRLKKRKVGQSSEGGEGSRKRRKGGPHICPICGKGFSRSFNL